MREEDVMGMRIEQLVQNGLPPFGVTALAERGIEELDDMQEAAVRAGLFEGKNLLIMAPTSSGKTLVAELAALKHAVVGQGAIMLTSHKALAYEKYLSLRESYSRPGNLFVNTGIATGDEVTDEEALGPASIDVATYEKWYYMLIEKPQRFRDKSLVIIDELQNIGDASRGSTLESLLTWIKTVDPDKQLIGLSATIPNVEELARWLNADVIRAEHRPVPLAEEIWSDVGLFRRNRDSEREVRHVDNTPRSTDVLTVLRSVEQNEGLPCLVFCITRDQAEHLADSIAQGRARRSHLELLVNELNSVSESDPTIRILRHVLPKGVAFHNANLSHDERRLIESAFRDHKLDILCATPTLMAGVNLPVKTVVFAECYRRWESRYISTAEYQNMAGRAGRRGMQDEGKSILLARSGAELERFRRYLAADPDTVRSQLVGPNLV